MTMPNFLIIGAAKAGTTAAYRYLKQHPQIYMSPHKEPRFFALEGKEIDFRGPGDISRFRFVTDIESYRALFDGVTDEIAIGEASPWYLYVPQAPVRIAHHIPHVKLIAILRDPVERAFSNFLHAMREGLEPLSDFTEAMEAESERIARNWSYRWHYKQKGFYYVQLQRYFNLFSPEQIAVYRYEDFTNNTLGVIQDMFGFLEVDPSFVPDVTQKHNVSAMPRSKNLEEFLVCSNPLKKIISPLLPSTKLRRQLKKHLLRLNLQPRPTLSSEVRQKYIAEYYQDILQLQDLIQQDLSKWLNV
ncbi:sulfotransferase [Myxosarcina sp. GI1(2024)]